MEKKRKRETSYYNRVYKAMHNPPEKKNTYTNSLFNQLHDVSIPEVYL